MTDKAVLHVCCCCVGVGSNTSFKALPLACLAGLLVGLAVGFFIYYGGRSIKDLRVFFIVSTVMLFFIAAGQVSLGTQLFSKVGVFGYYAPWADQLSWQYRPMADWNACCSDEFADGKQFFVLARAVLGYQSRPTPIVLMLYLFYWAVIISVVIWKWRNGSLFDADYKRKRTLLKLTRKAASVQRKLKRSSSGITRLEGKLATDAASPQLQQQLADEQQRQQQLQEQLAAAELERDAEAERLEEEDRQIAQAAVAQQAAQELPAVDNGDGSSSGGDDSSGSSPAVVLIGEGEGKDVEMGLKGGLDLDQQQGKSSSGGGGWLGKLRRKQ